MMRDIKDFVSQKHRAEIFGITRSLRLVTDKINPVLFQIEIAKLAALQHKAKDNVNMPTM
jgi:hypothetical protein